MDASKKNFTEQDIQAVEAVLQKIDPRCIWSNLKRTDFTLSRFPNGFVNDVSRCKLTPDAQARLCRYPDRDFPEIVIKIFTKNERFPFCPVQRAIINTLASANDLSPRVIYVDEDVMVQQCIPNGRMPNDTDDNDQAFFEQTARKIARFHCMPAPVSMNRHRWDRFLEMCKTDLAGAQTILDGTFRTTVRNDPLLKREPVSALCSLNFGNLYKYFFSAGLDASNAPLVFAHLDSHRDNKIVQEIRDPKTGVVHKKLYFIDLDFAMFHYRGIDLGVYFECYGQKEFRFGKGSLPDEKRILEFVEIYLEECSQLLGPSFKDSPLNSASKLVAETKLFVLYSYFLSMWISLNAYFDPNMTPERRQEFVKGAITRANQFVDYHRIVSKQNVLPDIGLDFFYPK